MELELWGGSSMSSMRLMASELRVNLAKRERLPPLAPPDLPPGLYLEGAPADVPDDDDTLCWVLALLQYWLKFSNSSFSSISRSFSRFSSSICARSSSLDCEASATKNIWFSAGLEPTYSCFSDLRKSELTSMPSVS